MKSKSWLNIKNYFIEWQKILYWNYKNVFSFKKKLISFLGYV